MSTSFAFKQSLHLCSVSNLKILMAFQLRTFEVGFSGKLSGTFEKRAPARALNPGLRIRSPAS